MKHLTGSLALIGAAMSTLAGMEPPQVMLLGDSIREGYQYEVRQMLSGRARVVFPTENCRSSADLNRNVDRYLQNSTPDIVCFNTGLIDVTRNQRNGNTVPLEEYLQNLAGIMGKLRAMNPNVRLIFVTTTPIDEGKLAASAPGKPLMRLNADINRYNQAVRDRFPELETVDANALLTGGDYFRDYGTSLNDAGRRKLAAAIAGTILRKLPARTAPGPASELIGAPSLPVVLLLGDSIRMNYQAGVQKNLAGKYTVVYPAVNCQSSAYFKANLEQFTASIPRADIICFNIGLHDAYINQNGKNAVSPENYRRNLDEIIASLRRKYPRSKLYFVNTTPVIEERQAASPTYKRVVRKNSDLAIYNRTAEEAMTSAGIPILDLHAVIRKDPARLLTDDGIHLSASGQNEAAAFLTQKLTEGETRK